ncbi:hypothetical protein HUJ04_005221 [Dendroctonus ponderosae]|nr:hypothetical protein HUJ04_005221 [Dendroctonus ponderosae]
MEVPFAFWMVGVCPSFRMTSPLARIQSCEDRAALSFYVSHLSVWGKVAREENAGAQFHMDKALSTSTLDDIMLIVYVYETISVRIVELDPAFPIRFLIYGYGYIFVRNCAFY